jgi:hypothetical protein
LDPGPKPIAPEVISMKNPRSFDGWARALLLALTVVVGAGAQAGRPLSESEVATLLDLQIGEPTILSKIQRDGVCFVADEAAIDRLRVAGASKTLIAAVRRAGRPGGQAASPRVVKVASPRVEMPSMKQIVVMRPGDHPGLVPNQAVARGTRYDEAIVLPSGEKSEAFDIWWIPREGQGQRMVAGLTIDREHPTAQLSGPDSYFGLVRVVGKERSSPQRIVLTEPGRDRLTAGIEPIQTGTKFGQELVVPSGIYDLWFLPVRGDIERLAEKVEIRPGQLTEVE